jgi:hypothetical protein
MAKATKAMKAMKPTKPMKAKPMKAKPMKAIKKRKPNMLRNYRASWVYRPMSNWVKMWFAVDFAKKMKKKKKKKKSMKAMK